MHCGLLPTLDSRHSWLVADIGGTNARFAHLDPGGEIAGRRTLANDNFDCIEALIDAYRHELANELGNTVERAPVNMLLALALPVATGADQQYAALQFTNRPWRVSPAALARSFGLDCVAVVNDFVAAAAGTVMPDAAASTTLRTGVARSGVRVVLGPGTGLGVAGVIEGSSEPTDAAPGTPAPARIVDSEAGHMTFAASDDECLRVLRAAQARWGRVSWERLLCGSGVAWLDAFWRGSEVAHTPAEVVARARAHDADARAAIGWFSRALGMFAGDVCLALRAFGGVTLTGGVLSRLGDLLDREQFFAAFVAKGRLCGVLAEVPCVQADIDELALAGLANIVRGRVAVPGVQWVGTAGNDHDDTGSAGAIAGSQRAAA